VLCETGQPGPSSISPSVHPTGIADRCVEHPRRALDRHPLGHANQRRGHLHPATRVGGDHEPHARGQDHGGFALGEIARRRGVEQVAPSGAPAAAAGLGQLLQL
jgi:hypothetical protein